MFLFITILSFSPLPCTNSNTSHVLIYHAKQLSEIPSEAFKYISCSYLSCCNNICVGSITIQIHLMFLFIMSCPTSIIAGVWFKYISCSYLSMRKKKLYVVAWNSNTSHVLIYLYWGFALGGIDWNSNTSHVLIYPLHFW